MRIIEDIAAKLPTTDDKIVEIRRSSPKAKVTSGMVDLLLDIRQAVAETGNTDGVAIVDRELAELVSGTRTILLGTQAQQILARLQVALAATHDVAVSAGV